MARCVRTVQIQTPVEALLSVGDPGLRCASVMIQGRDRRESRPLRRRARPARGLWSAEPALEDTVAVRRSPVHRPECSLNPGSRRRLATPGPEGRHRGPACAPVSRLWSRTAMCSSLSTPVFPGAGPSTTHVAGSAPAPMRLANDGPHTHCNPGVIRTCLQAGLFSKTFRRR